MFLSGNLSATKLTFPKKCRFSPKKNYYIPVLSVLHVMQNINLETTIIHELHLFFLFKTKTPTTSDKTM